MGIRMGLHRELRRLRMMGAMTVGAYYARHLSNVLLVRPLNLVGPSRCQCPCCGWHGRRFLDFIDYEQTLANYVCPRCGSHARHRGLVVFLLKLIDQEQPGFRLLHFAPERAIASMLAADRRIKYVTSDNAPHAVNVRADIGAIPFRDGSFDLIVCCHVLEHLADDGPALVEIGRALAPHGQALIMVPMVSEWETNPTIEFGAPQPRLSNHWRLYGSDLPARISAAGLKCRKVKFSSFLTQALRERYQVGDDVILLCSKA